MKKYIYYKCKECGEYFREDEIEKLLKSQLAYLIQYDITVRKYFAPLLKHKVENKNEIYEFEKEKINKKLARLKEAYLGEVITLKEYNNDKSELEEKLNKILEEEKSDEELETYNFTFEDVMLRTDEMAVNFLKDKYMIRFVYQLWETMSKDLKKDFIMTYIDSIEAYKYGDKIKIKKVNYRKTFIEEYARLLMKNAVNDQMIVYDEEEQRDKIVYTTPPQEKAEFRKHVEKLKQRCGIEYYEVQKQITDDGKFRFVYEHTTPSSTLKLVPLLNKKRMYKNITHYGIIEVPLGGKNE